MEKLGLGDARQILAMLKGEEIASSKLSPRLTALLRQEGLLMLKNNGSRCKYRIAEAMRESCRTLLVQEFGLKCSLEEWISASSSMQTRADMVRMVGDSKAKKVNTFRGFLVDCYVQIDAMLDGKPFILHPMEGSSVFINQPDRFEIPENVIVVGMENAENFMQIRLQRWLFDVLFPGKQLLFVCRYPQENLENLRSWLLRIPNRYVHFGDFDLAGVHIYLSEFYAYLGNRSSFLVPSDIEERLAEGNAALYNQQYARFRNMAVTDVRLQPLVNMIHHYRRGYEQEGYIFP